MAEQTEAATPTLRALLRAYPLRVIVYALLRSFIASNFLLMLLTFCSIAFCAWSGWSSYVSGEWAWFQRSGPLVAFMGAAVAGRSIIRMSAGAQPYTGIERVTLMASTPDGRATVRRSPEAVKAQREGDKDGRAALLGLVLGLIGTLVSGYGDLPGRYLQRPAEEPPPWCVSPPPPSSR